MYLRDYRDIIGGTVLMLIGTSATLYALFYLEMGTVFVMGPGMFPAAIGFILALFGVAILLPALFRPGDLPDSDFRSLAAITAAILVFAVMIRPFGLIPAVIALTLVSSRADSELSPLGTLFLAAVLSLGATLIFRIGLGVPIAIVAWPW